VAKLLLSFMNKQQFEDTAWSFSWMHIKSFKSKCHIES